MATVVTFGSKVPACDCGTEVPLGGVGTEVTSAAAATAVVSGRQLYADDPTQPLIDGLGLVDGLGLEVSDSPVRDSGMLGLVAWSQLLCASCKTWSVFVLL
jgi:hypothetical protein